METAENTETKESADALAIYAGHLEYFGYHTESFDESPGFMAQTEGYGRIFVRPLGRGIVHSNYWNIAEHASDQDVELLSIINELNRSSYVSTYSVLEDGGLRIDAIYYGEYARLLYGEFMDSYHRDILNALRGSERLRQYREREKLALVN